MVNESKLFERLFDACGVVMVVTLMVFLLTLGVSASVFVGKATYEQVSNWEKCK